ncbi:MAG: hypothetical protein HZY73_03475 [Micropruina sp.]|nr:MAG: hypothetical protein HZY73_03475 [Micropruina sp.]
MTAQRNLSQSILQVVFSIFLGLVVTGFVGIAVNTFLPEPAFTEDMPYNGDPWQSWRLATALTLLVAATLIMVAALLLGDRVPVLANGVLLGGVFTMTYAVGVSIWAGNQWPRLAIIAVALVVTIAVGYWRFNRGRSWPAPAPGSGPVGADVVSADARPGALDEGAHASATGPLGAPAAGLDARIAAVEAKLDAIGRALSHR